MCDTLSRNGRFIAGNGVNDDHGGVWWEGRLNNWVTWAWSATDSEADLLAAMRSGRAWTGAVGTRTTLDLRVDDVCPMGSVSVTKVAQRMLRVVATDAPAGGHVDVLRFTRLSVRNSAGTVVSVSNPVWMLRKVPASGIPAARYYEVTAA